MLEWTKMKLEDYKNSIQEYAELISYKRYIVEMQVRLDVLNSKKDIETTVEKIKTTTGRGDSLNIEEMFKDFLRDKLYHERNYPQLTLSLIDFYRRKNPKEFLEIFKEDLNYLEKLCQDVLESETFKEILSSNLQQHKQHTPRLLLQRLYSSK
jgi:autonomous glycyl radical cofactor GrcA